MKSVSAYLFYHNIGKLKRLCGFIIAAKPGISFENFFYLYLHLLLLTDIIIIVLLVYFNLLCFIKYVIMKYILTIS